MLFDLQKICHSSIDLVGSQLDIKGTSLSVLQFDDCVNLLILVILIVVQVYPKDSG